MIVLSVFKGYYINVQIYPDVYMNLNKIHQYVHTRCYLTTALNAW